MAHGTFGGVPFACTQKTTALDGAVASRSKHMVSLGYIETIDTVPPGWNISRSQKVMLGVIVHCGAAQANALRGI